ncbi:MAG: hypothetical protein KKH77_07800 [Candidatus Omnitrophica bacterium]|nr:hypothetical protein [Candidatus Omnitrophota bacterium]MBU0881787.1 hypothetical protein [Candidatus Omnitrophota bacterium]MBU1808792.1 hypothetical protein [Candidatus Omnitrophota bacterium]
MSKFKAICLAVLTICLILLVTGNSYADKRSYVWTYEYQTMPKGWFETEFYLTEEQPNLDRAVPNYWKPQIELEYGITDHFDVSMYQMFKQSNIYESSTFEYDGFKIRGRYRVLEKDSLPIDILLYLEYIRPGDFKEPNELEEKLVLAKDIGRFNISYNQIFEQELESGGKAEYGYTAGISYAITPMFRIGAETKGNYTDGEYSVGPTISYTIKPKKAYIALGAVFGLNEKTDDMQTRLIVGYLF